MSEKKYEITETTKMIQREVFGDRYVGHDFRTMDFPAEIEVPVKKWLKNPKGILIIAGAYGCGKTALGASLVPVIQSDKSRTSRFLKEDVFFNKIKSKFGMSGPIELVVKDLTDDHFFYYDDLGSHAPKANEEEGNWRRDMIFSMVDHRYSLGWPTVITTNLSRSMLKEIYGPRVSSRLESAENTWIELHEAQDVRKIGL